MTLYVTNVPEECSEQDFRDFLKTRKIFYLRADKPLGRNYAFVRLASANAVESTIARLQKLKICDDGYYGNLNACLARVERQLLSKEEFEKSKAERRAAKALATNPTTAAQTVTTLNPDNSPESADLGPATLAATINLPSSPVNQLPSASQLSSGNVLSQQDTPLLGSDEPLTPSTSTSTPPTTQLPSSPISPISPGSSNTPPRLTSKRPRSSPGDSPGDSPEAHNSPKRHPGLEDETPPIQLALTESEDD
jgi:hypothetical protein